MKKQLVLVPRECKITAKDKEKLSKNGYLAIEIDKVSWVRIVTSPEVEISGHDLLLMALKAMSKSQLHDERDRREVQAKFTALFAEYLDAPSSDASRDAKP